LGPQATSETTETHLTSTISPSSKHNTIQLVYVSIEFQEPFIMNLGRLLE
jgi:hypothetical protein